LSASWVRTRERRARERLAHAVRHREAGTGLRVGLLVLTCVVAGIVVAGISLPLVGSLGLAARHEANAFDQLPSDLAEPALPQHSVLLDSAGHTLATLSGTEDRLNVKIDQVPAVMQEAIIAIEDSRFYEHHGIDFRGTVRALVRNGQSGQTRQGGSTLTQQYVKNVLEHSGDPAVRASATKDTLARKLREARYALALERRYTKAQILEKYLNIANFGNGKYGVGTAAQYYFSESVDHLTLPQAALLAGIVNAPTAYEPYHHSISARDRRHTVLTAMRRQGFIDDAELAAADNSPMPVLTQKQVRHADPCDNAEAPFFCDYVLRRVLEQDPALGNTLAERDDKIFNGGLRIKTSLDMTVQRAAQQTVNRVLSPNPSIVAMVAAVQPGTGRIQALAANRPYGEKTKAAPLASKVNFPATAFLQPGSTFKAFTLTTALKQGIGLHITFRAPNCYHSKIFNNPQPDDCFHNAGDGEQCLCDAVSGTWDSVNTFYIQLEEKTGVLPVKETAVDMGIPESDLGTVGAQDGAFTIGGIRNGASALDMATGYATLAARGLECDPRAIVQVTGAQGRAVRLTQPKACHQVIDQGVADTVTSVLEGVLAYGTAAGKGLDRPAAGKTGTTDGESAAWFVGYTPQLAMAVAMGHPTNPNAPMGTVQGVAHVFGGTFPATIWHDAMTQALTGKPVIPLPSASGSVANGKTVPVPNVVGKTPEQAYAILTAAGFNVAVGTKPVDGSGVPKRHVASQDPAGAGPQGTTVTLTLSSGKAKPAKPGKSPASASGSASPEPGSGSPTPGGTASASPGAGASGSPSAAPAAASAPPP
jgi:membrane peptidoglycan carboxypeptidase